MTDLWECMNCGVLRGRDGFGWISCRDLPGARCEPTMSVPVLALVGQPVRGVRAQVRRRWWDAENDPTWVPMWRTLRTVERRTERGEEWVYWTWDREGTTPDGRFDCGYSGNGVEQAEDAARSLDIPTSANLDGAIGLGHG